MGGLGVCARCQSSVPAERLEYGATGDLVCASCSAVSLQRSHSQGEGLTRARGMLIAGLALGGMGGASALMAPAGLNFKLLAWIDTAGPAIGWGIRVFMILVGGGLALGGWRLLTKAAKA